MKRYLSVYCMLLRLNFARLVIYRANFINSSISTIGWGVFSIIAILLLTSKTPKVFGWTRDELLILAGCVNIFLGIFRGLFSQSFDTLVTVMQQGKLDSFLMKPIDSQFLLSVNYVNLTGIFRVILGLGFVVYMLITTGIGIDVFSVVTFFFLLIFGVLLLYSLWYLVVTLTVWYPDLTNINSLMYSIDSTIRYPQEMYRQVKNFFFFFFLPYTFVIVVPTKALLHKLTMSDVLLLLFFAVLFFSLSRIFWRFALRYYGSASS